MDVSGYLKMIEGITKSNLLCRCCGSALYVLPGAQESICSFCESYVNANDINIVHSNREIENNLLKMQENAVEGRWQDGAEYADALATTNDLHFMFGVANFYRFYSDRVYSDVDYNLSGFMYSNAEKRSDELHKNKNNAMALISKSKEYLFKSIKLINDTPNPSESLLLMGFMSNIKLKRYVHAKKALGSLNAPSIGEIPQSYANMVFNVETNTKTAEKFISSSISLGIQNSFYYLSRHLAKNGYLVKAESVLKRLIEKTGMHEAVSFMDSLNDVIDASKP
ncbi:MAG: hypothetical protein M1569_01955 [Candidatus Marsarchaeota archaeon]|nr:hypothetical protein [Candidatus Marsarchaeota archaeon]MCL5413145.1 hypothetical protein [Candidatus Marsarchaeota archaeon]